MSGVLLVNSGSAVISMNGNVPTPSSSSLLDCPSPAMAGCGSENDVVLRRNSTEMAAFLNNGFEIRLVDDKVVSYMQI